MVAELVASGVEAGHPLGNWEAVRTLWGPYRLSVMQALWRKYGPPAYVSLGALAGTREADAAPERGKDAAPAEPDMQAATELMSALPTRPNPQAMPSDVLASMLAKIPK